MTELLAGATSASTVENSHNLHNPTLVPRARRLNQATGGTPFHNPKHTATNKRGHIPMDIASGESGNPPPLRPCHVPSTRHTSTPPLYPLNPFSCTTNPSRPGVVGQCRNKERSSLLLTPQSLTQKTRESLPGDLSCPNLTRASHLLEPRPNPLRLRIGRPSGLGGVSEVKMTT